MPHLYYTKEEFEAVRDNQQSLSDTIRRLETGLTFLCKPEKINGCYDYVPFREDNFLFCCRVASNVLKFLGKDPRRCKFLDVGCGVGTKVVLASHFFDSYGLEINPAYVDVAKAVCKCVGRAGDDSHVIQMDGRRFKKYSDFDVIYFYCPMCDPDKEKRLEQRIFSQAKRGTVFLAMGSFARDAKYLNRLTTSSIFIKGCKREAASFNAQQL